MVLKRIYIAGPMTGLPEFNYPAFNAKAAELRAMGYEVENPAENPEPECKSWQGYMRMSLHQIAQCDSVYMLPGWHNSKGARLEYQIASGLGLALMGHLGDGCELERDYADEDAAAAAGLVQVGMPRRAAC